MKWFKLCFFFLGGGEEVEEEEGKKRRKMAAGILPEGICVVSGVTHSTICMLDVKPEMTGRKRSVFCAVRDICTHSKLHDTLISTLTLEDTIA